METWANCRMVSARASVSQLDLLEPEPHESEELEPEAMEKAQSEDHKVEA